MSEYDNGFARAQRQYDAQVPKWVDAPDDNRATFWISGCAILNTRNMEILEKMGAYNLEEIGDDGPDCVYMGFEIIHEWDDYDEVDRQYGQTLALLRSIHAEYENEFESEYEEPDEDDERK
jgi:hypothetical protein